VIVPKNQLDVHFVSKLPFPSLLIATIRQVLAPQRRSSNAAPIALRLSENDNVRAAQLGRGAPR
jgi:hypothetical protein